MSIANIICQGPTGYLLTDSGYFHADGRVAFMANKVLELPMFRAAMTARGHLRAPRFAREAIQRHKPADIYQLLAAMPDILHDAMMSEGAGKSELHAREYATHVSIVYWCPRRGRTAGGILSSDRQCMPDWYEPYTVLPVSEATAPGIDIAEAIGRPANATDAAAFDPVQDGMRIMEAQRRSEWGFNHVAVGHHAAGAVRLTTVASQGVSTRIIHTWPDKIGRRVAL